MYVWSCKKQVVVVVVAILLGCACVVHLVLSQKQHNIRKTQVSYHSCFVLFGIRSRDQQSARYVKRVSFLLMDG